jgi:hypothetical protein
MKIIIIKKGDNEGEFTPLIPCKKNEKIKKNLSCQREAWSLYCLQMQEEEHMRDMESKHQRKNDKQERGHEKVTKKERSYRFNNLQEFILHGL